MNADITISGIKGPENTVTLVGQEYLDLHIVHALLSAGMVSTAEVPFSHEINDFHDTDRNIEKVKSRKLEEIGPHIKGYIIEKEYPDNIEEIDINFGEDYYVEAESFDWDEAKCFHQEIKKSIANALRRGTTK